MLVVLIPAAFLVAAFGYSTWHGTVLIALVGAYAFALAFGSRPAVRATQLVDAWEDRIRSRIASMSLARRGLLFIAMFVLLLAVIAAIE